MIVWFPLTKDTRNLGLSNYKLKSSTGESYITGLGKLSPNAPQLSSGKYYYVEGFEKLPDKATIMLWCIFTSKSTLFLYTNRNKTGYGISLMLFSGNGNINFDFGNGGRFDSGFAPDLNTWYHIAVTRTSTESKIYINGKLYNSMKYSPNTGSGLGDTLYIGASNTDVNPFTGRLQDFRIYNKVLSSKEIYEVSKGLILHYPFYGNRTNFKNLAAFNGFLRITWTGSVNDAGYFGLAYTKDLKVGDAVTISFDYEFIVEKIKGTSTYFRYQPSGATTGWTNMELSSAYVVQGVTEGVYTGKFVYTSTIKKTGYDIFNNLGYRVSEMTKGSLRIWNVQLEYGNLATEYIANPRIDTVSDCSGFGNNGFVRGDANYVLHTPVGTSGILFHSNAYINAGRGAMVPDALSYNFWFVPNNSSKRAGPLSCFEGGGYGAQFDYSNKTMNFGIYKKGVGYAAWYSVPWAELTEWAMWTFTFDGYSYLVYKNGELVKNLNVSNTKVGIGYNATNSLFINAEPNSNPDFPTKTLDSVLMSDLRIYATALTAEDVKELYETLLSVAEDSTLFCKQAIESDTQSLDSKGVFKVLDKGLNIIEK